MTLRLTARVLMGMRVRARVMVRVTVRVTARVARLRVRMRARARVIVRFRVWAKAMAMGSGTLVTSQRPVVLVTSRHGFPRTGVCADAKSGNFNYR